MENVIDIDGIDVTVKKINLYRSDELSQINSLFSELDKISSSCKIESSDSLEKVQVDLKSKFDTIIEINKRLSTILSKNASKYGDAAIKVANKFTNLR